MTPERWSEVKRIFLLAVDGLEHDHQRVLDQHCADDHGLRREVEAMLAGHAHERGIIDPPVRRPLIDETLGPYRVLREIGRGGMGTVYLAERADTQFEQQVAIKVVARGLESDALVERFRQERQILARLVHPNICRLLDGGTTAEGHPFLVMEHIEGEPIDRYCRTHDLSIAARLRLFRKVCLAVHDAHQHLVVHRDLKPSNILVTAEGEPKLLDFGTAKLLEPTARLAATTATGMWLLTPEFASPEQMRAEAVTTAADVYGLGAVLYVLLTGRAPFEIERLTPEAIRTVCEDQPQRPSKVRAAVGGRHLLTARQLEGDLDAIVMRALRKEPPQRYPSAMAFADDLGRHLDHQPVSARTGTWRYRAGRFAKRHRLGVVAAAIVGFSIACGSGATLWQWRKAVAARMRTEVTLSRLEQVNQLMRSTYHRADPDLHGGRVLSIVEVLANQAEHIAAQDRELDPMIRAVLFESIGDALMKLRQFEAAARPLSMALRIRAAERPIDEHAMATDQALLGKAYLRLKKHDRALPLLKQALRLRWQLEGASWSTADLIDDLGWLEGQTAALAEAEMLTRMALVMRRKLAIRRATADPEHRDVVQSLANLGVVLSFDPDRFAEAFAAFEEALAMRGRLGLSLATDAINDHNNFAQLLKRMASARRKSSANLLAFLLRRKADGHLRRALEIDRALIAEDHHERASIIENIGENLYRLGRLLGDADRQRALYRDAHTRLEASRALRETLAPDGHPDLARSHLLLGRVTRRLGDEPGALRHYREGQAIAERFPATTDPGIRHLLETESR